VTYTSVCKDGVCTLQKIHIKQYSAVQPVRAFLGLQQVQTSCQTRTGVFGRTRVVRRNRCR
jgi:hypothetical protein